MKPNENRNESLNTKLLTFRASFLISQFDHIPGKIHSGYSHVRVRSLTVFVRREVESRNVTQSDESIAVSGNQDPASFSAVCPEPRVLPSPCKARYRQLKKIFYVRVRCHCQKRLRVRKQLCGERSNDFLPPPLALPLLKIIYSLFRLPSSLKLSIPSSACPPPRLLRMSCSSGRKERKVFKISFRLEKTASGNRCRRSRRLVFRSPCRESPLLPIPLSIEHASMGVRSLFHEFPLCPTQAARARRDRSAVRAPVGD